MLCFCTLLEVFSSGTSLSDRSLFSISSQFLSLSLNNILERRDNVTSWPFEPAVSSSSCWDVYLIFPAVLSTECLILVESWETELSSRLSSTAWRQRQRSERLKAASPHSRVFSALCVSVSSPPPGSRFASSELAAPRCRALGGGAPPADR